MKTICRILCKAKNHLSSARAFRVDERTVSLRSLAMVAAVYRECQASAAWFGEMEVRWHTEN
jgi:hypothetical protein